MEFQRILRLPARYEDLRFAFLSPTAVAGSAMDSLSRCSKREQFPYRGVPGRAHDARAGDQPRDPFLDLFDLAET